MVKLATRMRGGRRSRVWGRSRAAGSTGHSAAWFASINFALLLSVVHSFGAADEFWLSLFLVVCCEGVFFSIRLDGSAGKVRALFALTDVLPLGFLASNIIVQPDSFALLGNRNGRLSNARLTPLHPLPAASPASLRTSCLGPQKGQVGYRNGIRARRLGVLGLPASAMTRETVVDDPPPLPEAPAAPLPTGEHGDDSGGRVGGSARHHNVTANMPRGRQECFESQLTRLSGEVSRQLELVAAGERELNGSRQCGGGGGRLCLQEQAQLLRTEETAILTGIAERRDRVAALAEELCHVEDAVEEVGVGNRHETVGRAEEEGEDRG